MPIKFRCPHCQQFLGISRSRAGAVTDCPMCGRSIRVPLLDGSVEPLPAPQLDLGDHGLASALDKLASLVSSEGDAGAAAQPPAAAPPVRTVADASPQPIPLPEPIVLEPAPQPVVLTAPAAHAAAAPSAPAVPGQSEQILASLAAAESLGPGGDHRRHRSAAGRNSVAMVGLGAVVLAAASFWAGLSVGRRQQPSPGPVGEAASPAAPAAPDAAGPPAAAAEAALSGRIQYVDAAGDTRPDGGARILLLPEERTGTARLPADGFRPGAAAADVALAVASVRTLGGDFVIADGEGRYAAALPQAGLYQLVILSRYQPRPEGEPPDGALVQFLGGYFDRPQQVIGDAATYSRQFRYRGSDTSHHDQSFERH